MLKSYIYEWKGKKPQIDPSCVLLPGAHIIGDVRLDEQVNVWFNSVIRGDVDRIEIGKQTNIQDGCILHVSEGSPLTIGSFVTLGHNAILHACTVEDHCLIGMGATILDGSRIGRGSLVAAGSVVPPGKEFPENSLIRGAPAKVVRSLETSELNEYNNHYRSYLELVKTYQDGFRPLDT